MSCVPDDVKCVIDSVSHNVCLFFLFVTKMAYRIEYVNAIFRVKKYINIDMYCVEMWRLYATVRSD